MSDTTSPTRRYLERRQDLRLLHKQAEWPRGLGANDIRRVADAAVDEMVALLREALTPLSSDCLLDTDYAANDHGLAMLLARIRAAVGEEKT